MPKTTTENRPELKPVNFGAAAIDIGSKMHMAAVNPACTDVAVRSFGTFTSDLHDLADWFKACSVTSVAMESTGVYWIPVYEILEQRGFDVILVNARFAKNVPGRKTDVSDAAWLRQLHSYGLLRGSFRPDAEIATLRAYLRQRERLVEYAAAHIQHSTHPTKTALFDAGYSAAVRVALSIGVCRSWVGTIFRQAFNEKSGPVSGDHFGFVRLVSAFSLLDLLGTAPLCSLAIFRCDCVGVDNFLSKGRFKRYECCNES